MRARPRRSRHDGRLILTARPSRRRRRGTGGSGFRLPQRLRRRRAAEGPPAGAAAWQTDSGQAPCSPRVRRGVALSITFPLASCKRRNASPSGRDGPHEGRGRPKRPTRRRDALTVSSKSPPSSSRVGHQRFFGQLVFGLLHALPCGRDGGACCLYRRLRLRNDRRQHPASSRASPSRSAAISAKVPASSGCASPQLLAATDHFAALGIQRRQAGQQRAAGQPARWPMRSAALSCCAPHLQKAVVRQR